MNLTRWLSLLDDASRASNTAYNARAHNHRYHTFRVGNQTYHGQRDPRERLHAVPYDFNNKTVLDIGTNAGGMLFELLPKIRHGIGFGRFCQAFARSKGTQIRGRHIQQVGVPPV